MVNWFHGRARWLRVDRDRRVIARNERRQAVAIGSLIAVAAGSFVVGLCAGE